MNRTKALRILEVYGSGKTNGPFRFSRCNMSDVERIEKLSKTKLLSEIKATYYQIYVIQCSSLFDQQELDLLLCEAEDKWESFTKKVQKFLDSWDKLREGYEKYCMSQSVD